jgi:hypothetical protein
LIPLLSGRAWSYIRVLWVLAGIAFTIARVVRYGADSTALAGLAFTLVVFILPSIKGFKLPGGTEIELQSQEVVRTLEVEQVNLIDAVSHLLISYTAAIGATDVILMGGSSVESKRAFAMLKTLRAIEESIRWFAVGEPVRVLVYRYQGGATFRAGLYTVAENVDAIEPGLYFVTGNVDEAEALALKREFFATEESGDDLIVRCWRRQMVANMSEASTRERPAVPDPKNAFHGIMTIPLRYADGRWGILVVERKQAEPFNLVAERVGAALGNVIVAALGHPALEG